MASMQYLRIVGNSVQCVNETVEREFPLENFMASIESSMSIESGMLPRNCLFVKKTNMFFIYVVELQAQLVSCNVPRREAPLRFRVSIPFTQFYFAGNTTSGAIGNIYMTCTKKPLMSLTQKVFVVPYLNIYDYGEGRVCTGSMSVPPNIPLSNKINSLTWGFFESNFNSDLSPCTPEGWSYENAVQYMGLWQEKTNKNRLLMTSDEVVLREHPKTPYQIIEGMSR